MRPDELIYPLNYHAYLAELSLRQNSLVLEIGFWVVVLLGSLIFLKWYPSIFQKIEAAGVRLSRRSGLVILLAILSSLALRLAFLPLIPIPAPVFVDEQSYLFQAQTFASGRITNPTPAGWEHLETFHINLRPTYHGMYPPGQALVLAAAEVVHAHPWWGVWLSVGLMCGAVSWMLQGWMPPQWALLGTIFCVVRFSTFSYWINSYFGGAVAAIGGALVFGVLPRLKRSPKASYWFLLALGLALLANTRPYEGLVFSVVPMLALLLWLVRNWKRAVVRFTPLAPALALLLAVGGGMAYYNWRCTGNPLLMPYVLNQREYHITKPFIWQARYPMPNYRHPAMQTFFVFHELPDYLNRKYPEGMWKITSTKFKLYYDFFIWPMLIPAIFACWAIMKSRRMWIFSATLLLFLAALLVEQWPPAAHYAAPALGVSLTVLLYGLRLLWTLRPKGRLVGPMIVRSAVLVFLAWMLVPLGAAMLNPYRLGLILENGNMPDELDRMRLVAQLARTPGQHIVFVHIRFPNFRGAFWIYNDPDISRSKIIWAYDMGNAANAELMRLYPGRRGWIVDQDDGRRLLNAYAPENSISRSSERGT
jgi:hypothetical protein